jgi:modulator of FtsH protease
MALPAFAAPVAQAEPSERVAYLRKVAILSLSGLLLAATTAAVSTGVLVLVPALQSRIVSLVIIMGGWAAVHMGMASIVNGGGSTATKTMAFYAGSAIEGMTFGFLLLQALAMGAALFGNPFTLVFQACGLVALAAFGMTAYLLSGPKDFSMIKGGLVTMSLPMMGLMVLSFVYPIGGIFGVLISAAFVVFSAAGLMYSLNKVIHEMPVTAVVEGAFALTMGLLVLLWNVLVLLMRLQGRD